MGWLATVKTTLACGGSPAKVFAEICGAKKKKEKKKKKVRCVGCGVGEVGGTGRSRGGVGGPGLRNAVAGQRGWECVFGCVGSEHGVC